MKLYGTSIRAINPLTGELTSFSGPDVPGISFADAEDYCQRNGLGYCKVDGVIIAKVECKKGSTEPDWGTMVDFDGPTLN